jgi:2-polyprenyl-3-methyl-5-hydroxy-6-metoxy-1,4-benzoquinol methylase
MNDASPDVIEREREYHNARFTEETRVAQDKYYYAIRACDDEYERLLQEHARDAVVLDYGCALGEYALSVAPVAKAVYGIDISDVAIATATREAAARGLTNAHFSARDAHDTGFEDNTFDFVFGIGIIHHLDTRKSLTEVARVLKPGGVAIFREPLGCNVVINMYRAATPAARTVDEHPLTPTDYKIAQEIFTGNDWEFHGLSTLASVPFRTTGLGEPLNRATGALDKVLFQVPGLKWQAWCALMKLTK